MAGLQEIEELNCIVTVSHLIQVALTHELYVVGITSASCQSCAKLRR